MASGDLLLYFTPASFGGPAASTAAFDAIVGGSTPAENWPAMAFDTSTQEYVDWRGHLPGHYGGGGLTAVFMTSASTTTGGIVWEAAVRAVPDDAEVITAAHTYVYQSVIIATLPTAVGEFTYDSIVFTSGAQMDNLVAGQEFMFRARRAPTHASDTAAGDAYLHGIALRET
jgi:hypothetical protein